jgi:hypothetical protein
VKGWGQVGSFKFISNRKFVFTPSKSELAEYYERITFKGDFANENITIAVGKGRSKVIVGRCDGAVEQVPLDLDGANFVRLQLAMEVCNSTIVASALVLLSLINANDNTERH